MTNSYARLLLVLGACLFVGCPERVPPPTVPTPDAGGPRDAGPGMDARVVRRDAGPPGPAIDGTLDADEWRGAAEATADVETDRGGSVLTRLLATIEGDRLFVGVEGSLAEGDALLVYVDGARGDGLGVTDTSAFDDTDVPLDAALSNAIELPSDVALDVAFGAVGLGRSAPSLDPNMGWRDLSGDPMSFTWIGTGGVAPSACSASACEAAIQLSRLQGEAPRTIALFARIVSAEGGFTNQTLPEDDAGAPTTVSALLELEQDPPPGDAGMPDAGPFDAGPVDAGGAAGIVVDGVLGAGEWDGVTVFENSTPPSGAFVNDALSGLRVVRDAERLYFALTGRVSNEHAFTVYIDHDLGGGDGLASPTPLDDLSGALDRALTRSLFTPGEVRIDAAWGSLDMNRSTSASDDRMGWRDLGSNPSAFATLSGQSACGANVCEASILLSELGVLERDSVALFARLVDGQSDVMSNQTLPMDGPTTPEFITVYVTASAP